MIDKAILAGPMPDDNDHYVVFQVGSTNGYRCSDDSFAVPKLNLHDGLRKLLRSQGVENQSVGEEGLRKLTRRMLEALDASEFQLKFQETYIDIAEVRRIVEQRSPIESAGYIARMYFGAELLILE